MGSTYPVIALDLGTGPVVNLHHHSAPHQISDPGTGHWSADVPVIVCNLLLSTKCAGLKSIYHLSIGRCVNHDDPGYRLMHTLCLRLRSASKKFTRACPCPPNTFPKISAFGEPRTRICKQMLKLCPIQWVALTFSVSLSLTTRGSRHR
jgi:hypothetical protein